MRFGFEAKKTMLQCFYMGDTKIEVKMMEEHEEMAVTSTVIVVDSQITKKGEKVVKSMSMSSKQRYNLNETMLRGDPLPQNKGLG